MNKATGSLIKGAIIIVVILAAVGILAAVLTPHFYFLQRVEADEVGVRLRGGRIADIVPPGIYSDVGLYVSIVTYSTQSYQFTVSDPEVITSDSQRLGITVSGSVFRPGTTDAEVVKKLWVQYRNVYTTIDALQNVMSDLTTQAMKVCVGDRPFRESVIGSDRDALRNCIDDELNKLAESYGLSVANVIVPNVSLSPEVTALLDAITKSRLETEKAEQDRLKAVAEGTARQAEQEATIRVEQSKIQEETRQQTTLATLNEEKLKAQFAVIGAQKANDLLGAQKDLEINKALAVAAIEKARADLAQQIALAELYANNDGYLQLQMMLANASAIKSTDKLIFIPAGTFPQLVFGNVTPVFPVASGTPVENTPQ
jgi:hypothetical protein